MPEIALVSSPDVSVTSPTPLSPDPHPRTTLRVTLVGGRRFQAGKDPLYCIIRFKSAVATTPALSADQKGYIKWGKTFSSSLKLVGV